MPGGQRGDGTTSIQVAVDGQGEGWADVTEGNPTTWERERYTWESDGRTVSAETTDSNVWAAGSRWDSAGRTFRRLTTPAVVRRRKDPTSAQVSG